MTALLTSSSPAVLKWAPSFSKTPARDDSMFKCLGGLAFRSAPVLLDWISIMTRGWTWHLLIGDKRKKTLALLFGEILVRRISNRFRRPRQIGFAVLASPHSITTTMAGWTWLLLARLPARVEKYDCS